MAFKQQRRLGKVDKVYLDNTNIIYNLVGEKSNVGNLRETFFFNQMRVKNEVISSKHSDFVIEDYTFDVGGKNKYLHVSRIDYHPRVQDIY